MDTEKTPDPAEETKELPATEPTEKQADEKAEG
jgi:hypothetical protein